MTQVHRPNNQPLPPPEARFPTEYPIGTVLAFQKKFGTGEHPAGGAYGYVALRAADGKWYLTGREATAYSWNGLVRFIGDGPCSIVTEWLDIPQNGSGDLGDPAQTPRAVRRDHWPFGAEIQEW